MLALLLGRQSSTATTILFPAAMVTLQTLGAASEALFLRSKGTNP
jgi:hypothetical protein